VLAITLHEAAHGYVARRFGDNTAYVLGRVTLNPLKHIDPIGTVLLPLMTMVLGGVIFGWAKPVPVNFGQLRNPRRDTIWVAGAGPAANFLMAIMWTLLFKLAVSTDTYFSEPLSYMAKAGININIVLMVLNLVPILPLDGGRILGSLLPPRMAWRYSMLEPYGMWILLALIMTGLLTPILLPFINLMYHFLQLFF
jgi:Zn-dependent protease